jgi:hypothetical protein
MHDQVVNGFDWHQRPTSTDMPGLSTPLSGRTCRLSWSRLLLGFIL